MSPRRSREPRVSYSSSGLLVPTTAGRGSNGSVDHEYYLDPSKPLIPVLIGNPELPGFLKTRQALVLEDKTEARGEAADKIVRILKDPAASVDESKLELGRQARQQALESFRRYAETLEKEDIKRAGIRALE